MSYFYKSFFLFLFLKLLEQFRLLLFLNILFYQCKNELSHCIQDGD